jgi:hypothetical protein
MLGVNPIYELRENGSARMHARTLTRKNSKKMRRTTRGHPQIAHMPFSTLVPQNKALAAGSQGNNRMILIPAFLAPASLA